MNVLFILDGSLSNPILHSQGIPHILENSKKGINYFVLSFENSTEDPENNKWYAEARKVLKEKAKIFSIKVSSPKILRGFIILLFFPFAIRKTFQIVKQNNIEIIHGRSNRPTLIGLVLKLFLDVKVLYDNRGLVSDEIDSSRFIRVKIETILEKILIKYSDKIVVVSKTFQEYLEKKYSKIFKPEKFFIVRNCFSNERFKFSQELRKRQLELLNLSGRFIMVYSGPSVGWQRFDVILKIFKRLKQLKQNAFFLVISYDPEIEKTTKNAGITKEDFRVYNLPPSEVNKFLLTGDFGVILSDYKLRRMVSAPIKFGEYLASGLPILMMTKIGDTEDIINKYNVGILSENEDQLFGEALMKIINLTQVPGIKEKCRLVAEKELSLTFAANQYYDIYKTLINQNNLFK